MSNFARGDVGRCYRSSTSSRRRFCSRTDTSVRSSRPLQSAQTLRTWGTSPRAALRRQVYAAATRCFGTACRLRARALPRPLVHYTPRSVQHCTGHKHGAVVGSTPRRGSAWVFRGGGRGRCDEGCRSHQCARGLHRSSRVWRSEWAVEVFSARDLCVHASRYGHVLLCHSGTRDANLHFETMGVTATHRRWAGPENLVAAARKAGPQPDLWALKKHVPGRTLQILQVLSPEMALNVPPYDGRATLGLGRFLVTATLGLGRGGRHGSLIARFHNGTDSSAITGFHCFL